MLTTVYMTAGITAMFMLVMMLSRYVFMVPTFRNWLYQYGFMVTAWVICNGVCYFFGTKTSRLVLGVIVALYIFLTGSGKAGRILRMAEVFPIMGIAFGLFFPPLEIPAMLLGIKTRTAQIYGIVLAGLLVIALLYFAYAGHKWQKDFSADTQFRKLQHWERTLLYVIGMLMLLSASTISTYKEVEDTVYRSMIMRSTCIMSFIIFTVTLTIIVLIIQGSRSAHFREQVMQMQHNIIITMADIVENRDENTGGHIRRTAKYVEIIALHLKEEELYLNILTDQYISDMITAAPLHDIGKIHIPDAVLKKEGKFTPEEYEIMKSHTTSGKRLLQQAERTLGNSSYLDIAVQMAGYHHEWWNGRGYPEGLRGQDIPLCARIMAVADVFDAIVSQRCYKGAMSIDEAYELIRHDSGTHFDPVLVDVFIDARDEITAIAQEFADHPQRALHASEAPEEDADAGETSEEGERLQASECST